MSLIAVSQRVEVDSQFGERRDCLDRLWTKFYDGLRSDADSGAE